LPADANLLVGLATGDDAGVYRIAPGLALVQTLDFFTPIVDDPYLFGQIAATNALSDVYAMGGTPITAMNILCYPIKDRDPEELLQILKGGADKVAEAGASLVGGHSVVDQEPKYGLSVTGTVDPDHVATNAGAMPGDIIVLTKPIGTGIISTAAKFGECSTESFAAAAKGMTTLNAGAAQAMRTLGIGANGPVHAATDITGFSLIGHLYHLAKASGVAIRITADSVPRYPGTVHLAEKGNTTAGGSANREYIGSDLVLEADLSPAELATYVDPQTSGGLAICVSSDYASELVSLLARAGTLIQAVVGEVVCSDRATVTLYR
jgi:selenide,water dikinase